jgi:PAS domain S-box-containing protein
MTPAANRHAYAAFAAALALLALGGFGSHHNNNRVIETAEAVTHTHTVLEKLNAVFARAADAQTSARGYALTGFAAFLDPYRQAPQALEPTLAELRRLLEGTPRQQERLIELEEVLGRSLAFHESVVGLRVERGLEAAAAAVARGDGEQLMNRVRRLVQEMKDEESRLLEQRRTRADATARRSRLAVGAGSLVSVGLLLVAFHVLQRESRRRERMNRTFDAVLDTLPLMLFLKDARDLAFVRFNRAGARLLGRQQSEIVGKTDYDIVSREQAEFFRAKDREVLRERKEVDIAEEPIQTPAGERWLHTRKVPILDEQGQPELLLGISEDITERKIQVDTIRRLHAELEQQVVELRGVNEELESFSYSVSHDLRSPLRAIHGFSRALQEDFAADLHPEAQRYIEIVRKNAARMAELIDDLLDFSRLGRTELRLARIDMEALVREVIEELRQQDALGKASVEIGELPAAHADRALVREVLVNLLGNAVKYSGGRARPQVRIDAVSDAGSQLYRVSDNGVGFDMQYAHKLFGVFQRLHAATEFEGTGVGLAIVQRIVHRHGGRVTAQGRLGEGATFSFSLPAAREASDGDA